MSLPSKELLEEVLNLKITDYELRENRVMINLFWHKDNSFNRENGLYGKTYGCERSINIYELAHKCKEWAIWQDYNIVIKMRVPNVYKEDRKIDYGYFISTYANDNIEMSWWSDTEVEAVFRACEWILKHKRIKR